MAGRHYSAHRNGLRRLPDLPLPPDPDLALPDIYAPPIEDPDGVGYGDGPARRRSRQPVVERDEDRPLARAVVAVARAVPATLVAGTAIGGLVAGDLLPESDFPVVLGLVLAGQAFGLAVARANGLTVWVTTFVLNLATLAVVLPLLAIQATATRSPHVSTLLGTSRPAIVATVAAIVALVVVGLASIVLAFAEPEGPPLMFLPAALLVPALLGTGPTLAEREVSARLAEVFGLVALATFGALLLPVRLKPIVGPLALAGYFAVLIVLDRGPTREPTSSEVARALDGSLVAVATLLTVAIPVVAFGFRLVMRSVEAVERSLLLEHIAEER
jgi:hypothetical protein